jgi:hypothetical protein
VPLQVTFNKRSFATEAFRCMFFGNDEAPALYRKAADHFQKIGGERVNIDFTPFPEAAELLYSGPSARRAQSTGAEPSWPIRSG